MPHILMIVGAVLILVGMGSIAAGAPDWVLGLSLGATLIQSGTIAFVGGIVLIALAVVLYTLQDLLRKLDTLAMPAARPAAAAAPEPVAPQIQRQPSADEHRSREGPAGGDEIVRPRREAPSGPAADPPARTRREPAPGFPSDDQMRIRRETPAYQEEEQPRPRREAPASGTGEDPARARRERASDQTGDDLARHREYQPARRRDEPARPAREAPSLPPLPQVPGSDDRRRARSSGEDQAESYVPRFRPVDPAPSAPVRNPAAETVVRSGVIGGMAYTLYADGSIEAELAIGTVRFGSIAELQDHVMRTGAEADVDFKEQSR